MPLRPWSWSWPPGSLRKPFEPRSKNIMDYTTETRDGMTIDWDVPITMDDGNVLRADVFRPIAPGKYPVIMTHGPYGKGLAFQEGYKTPWDLMAARYPDALEGSTNQYQSWEVTD